MPLLSFLRAVSQGQVGVFCFFSPISTFVAFSCHCHRASVPSWSKTECAEKKARMEESFCLTSRVQIGVLWCWLLSGCLLQPDNQCFLHLWKWKDSCLCRSGINYFVANAFLSEKCWCAACTHARVKPHKIGMWERCCRNRESGVYFWAIKALSYSLFL